jgi:hypothetical protein
MFIDFDEARGDAVDRLIALDRVSARVEAVRAELLVEAVSLEAVVDEYALFTADSDEQRLIRIEDAVRDELGCALRRSPVVMQAMIDTARWLCGTRAPVEPVTDPQGREPGRPRPGPRRLDGAPQGGEVHPRRLDL